MSDEHLEDKKNKDQVEEKQKDTEKVETPEVSPLQKIFVIPIVAKDPYY